MSDESHATISRTASDCAICRRSVLVGEPLTPFSDPRSDRVMAVCGLCRDSAVARGWTHAGEPVRRRGSARLRVEHVGGGDGPSTPLALAPAPQSQSPAEMSAPQVAILERAIGLDARHVDAGDDSALRALQDRVRRQQLELEHLRRELHPARRAEEQRIAERQQAQLRELRAELADRERRIEQLQRARHDETSPMRMSAHALAAFNQSRDLERMARIARTLGDPVVNVHDEGPGIPRRVRITLSWDIAWYEFMVKLDLGMGRASVHETGTGGDPTQLPLELRRANAGWSDSGLKLT
ncbi:MAG: hypothetical protein KDC46_01805 [Thermoleophilia bacterium]|nr:hypothetical protein [Thermoleophilia bacterium]